MNRFENKVAVVTGGAGGIGEATVRRLVSEGAKVAIADVTDATELAVEISETGGSVIYVPVDLTDIEQIGMLFDEVERQFGPVEVLINNAGYLRHASALEVSWDEWHRTFSVNVDAVLATAKRALPSMIEAGRGAIVNTASVGGLFGVPGLNAYNASKGAVVNLTRNLAVDYRRQGVRINCVCPGWVPTGFNDPMLVGFSDDELQAMVEAGVPAGRQADPSEIASAIAFLASEDASYVSGEALVVDGGMTAAL